MPSLPASTLCCAASTSPSTSVVRRIACSADSGIGQPQRVRVRVVGGEAPGVGLGEAAAGEHVLDEAAQPLLLGEPAEHGAALREA